MSLLVLLRSRAALARRAVSGLDGLKVIYVRDQTKKSEPPKPAIEVATKTETRAILKKAKASNLKDKQIISALSMQVVHLDSAANALQQLESALIRLAEVKAQEEYRKSIEAKRRQIRQLLQQEELRMAQEAARLAKPKLPSFNGFSASDDEDILLLLALISE